MIKELNNWQQVNTAGQIVEGKGGIWTAARFKVSGAWKGPFLFAASEPSFYSSLKSLIQTQAGNRYGGTRFPHIVSHISAYAGGFGFELQSWHSEEILIREVFASYYQFVDQADQLVVFVSDSPCTMADGGRKSKVWPSGWGASCLEKLAKFSDVLEDSGVTLDVYYGRLWGALGSNNEGASMNAAGQYMSLLFSLSISHLQGPPGNVFL